jgi:L-threonylcarbamoyladenylate synthase
MRARLRPALDPEALAEAARRLHAGGLVAFPTETVYGLGAHAFDASAATRIFVAKGRPAHDPLIVHVADAEHVVDVAQPLEAHAAAWLERLAQRFWPGPLTLVLARQRGLPDVVTAGLDSVAVRVPAHPAAQALLRASGLPIAAPSANPFGYVSPTTAQHVDDQLGAQVDLILDGGACAVGVESTIVTLLEPVPRLLRPGGIPREALEDTLGLALGWAPGQHAAPARPLAPGQLESHYAPATPLRLLEHAADILPAPTGRVGLLAFERPPSDAQAYAAIEVLAPDGRLETAAARLFAALRRLDALQLDGILAEPVPPEGLGLAIQDRLQRAAARR